MNFKKKNKQILVSVFLSIGSFLLGNAMGWCAPMIRKLQDPKQTPLLEEINLIQASWVASSLILGAIFGTLIGGYVSNSIGRKKCNLLGGLLITVGNIILTMSYTLQMMLAGRLIAGVSAGIINVTHIVYIGEIASKDIRGFLLSLCATFYCIGLLLVTSVGFYTSYMVTGLMISLTASLYLIGCFFIPESPVYLLLKGHEERALEVLQCLERTDELDELNTMINKTSKNVKRNGKFCDIFTIKSNRRSFFLGLTMMSFQAFSGIVASSYFASHIFYVANSSIEPSIATIVIGFIQFLGTLVVPQLIERNGRKVLLLLSSFGCCISFAVLGTYFYLQTSDASEVLQIRWLPLASLITSFFSYSIGIGIIPDTLLGELFRPNVRSIGSATIITLSSAATFVILTSFGYIVERLGNHTVFWLFAVVNAVNFIFTFLCVPETKGMSLAEIQIKLAN